MSAELNNSDAVSLLFYPDFKFLTTYVFENIIELVNILNVYAKRFIPCQSDRFIFDNSLCLANGGNIVIS